MTPDSAVPVVGLRSWRVAPGGVLRSVTRPTCWPGRTAVAAACTWPEEAEPVGAPTHERYTAHPDVEVPAVGCACGIYLRAWPVRSATSSDDLPGMPGPVVGFAALWGKVVLDERTGIHRGQYAVPLAVCTRHCRGERLAVAPGFPEDVVPPGELGLVADRYDVPLGGELDELFDMARDEMARRMLSLPASA